MNTSPKFELVHVQGERLSTTSLLVAEKFKKRHDHVLEKIRNLKCSAEFHGANFREMSPDSREISYADSYGREQKAYEITEEGFMFVAMRFTGKEAVEWQEKFINAFQSIRHELDQIKKRQSEPAWQINRDETKLGYKWMSDALCEKRTEKGKETKNVHYMSEAKLINAALSGRFNGIDRNKLSKTDLFLISELQRANAMLIAQDIAYQERKQALFNRAALISEQKRLAP
jgi:Rha family phage regulatory protein